MGKKELTEEVEVLVEVAGVGVAGVGSGVVGLAGLGNSINGLLE